MCSSTRADVHSRGAETALGELMTLRNIVQDHSRPSLVLLNPQFVKRVLRISPLQALPLDPEDGKVLKSSDRPDKGSKNGSVAACFRLAPPAVEWHALSFEHRF
jgi:hypothetical protein